LRIASLQSSGAERANIIANVIDKFVSEGEKTFASLTLDDATSQIRAKAFGIDISKFNGIEIGDTVLVIGSLKYFNNELYILPEIARKVDPRWLLVRKLELQEKEEKISNTENKEEIFNFEENAEKSETANIKEKILSMLKKEEELDIEQLILQLKENAEQINSAISALLEEALIYEPCPGKIRAL